MSEISHEITDYLPEAKRVKLASLRQKLEAQVQRERDELDKLRAEGKDEEARELEAHGYGEHFNCCVRRRQLKPQEAPVSFIR